MNSFAFLLVCIQACLVQSVFSQCTSRAAVAADRGIIGGYGLGAPYGLGCGYGLEAPYGWAGYADYGYGLDAYGGIGEGNVAVAGELPVAGTTAVAGQVPIMGAVKFGGDVCAAGSVSIAGKCDCGCGEVYGYGLGAPYLY
uniref:Chorion class A protein Ld2/Ld41 n=1 Tax=Lymantria dispar TaxID=13123 RepID=CHA2A_LYMDI|nr:RecName: Full=Chorion class A protein Ld2/Ld41; Flags: Precursor [Lymantria dispar]AAA67858.1 chorion protein [Lymantria dispar]